MTNDALGPRREPSSEEVLAQARQRMAERQDMAAANAEAQRTTRVGGERHWLLIFAGVMTTLFSLLIFMPGLPLQWKMYAVVHGVCAQQHNIFLAGMQFPICARNTGIYSSFLLTVLFVVLLGRGLAGRLPPWPITGVIAALMAIMTIDGFNSLFVDIGAPYFYDPRNDVRTLTGMGFGVGIAVIVMLMFNLSLRRDVHDQQPIIAHWWELALILGLNLLVHMAIYGNLDFMFWPLAFLAFFGITSVLYAVNVLMCGLLLGYANQVTRLRDLARPATFAVLPTLVMLGVLGGLRFWMEAQGVML